MKRPNGWPKPVFDLEGAGQPSPGVAVPLLVALPFLPSGCRPLRTPETMVSAVIPGSRAKGLDPLDASLTKVSPQKSADVNRMFSLVSLDPAAGLDPAVREVTRTRLFAERTMFTTPRMSFLLRLQTELLTNLMKNSSILLTGLLVIGALQPRISMAQYGQFVTREAGPYFSMDGGGNIPEGGGLTDFGGFAAGRQVSYDAGATLNVAAGFQFNRYLAAELQSGWNINSIDSIPGFVVSDTYVSSVPFLVNAVFQWPIPRTILVPFIGAGVGGAATFFDTDYMDNGFVTLVGGDSDFVFAWQAFAGLRFHISDQLSAGVAYKYFNTDDSSYHYPPFYYGDPDLRLGFEGMQLHQIVLTCTLKF